LNITSGCNPSYELDTLSKKKRLQRKYDKTQKSLSSHERRQITAQLLRYTESLQKPVEREDKNDNYRPSNDYEKMRMNLGISGELKALCYGRKRSCDIRCLVLDDENARTSSELRTVANVLPHNITIPNFNSLTARILGHDGYRSICMYVEEFLETCDATKKFDCVFLDYCGSINGSKENGRPLETFETLFSRDLLQPSGTILATTFCYQRYKIEGKPHDHAREQLFKIAESYGWKLFQLNVDCVYGGGNRMTACIFRAQKVNKI
jgi:hypothetical protein